VFHLIIDYRAAVDVTKHPSREVAHGALLKHLDRIDCDYRVTQAGWEHSSYELLTRCDVVKHGRAAPIAGHAVIEEVCACEDPVTEHEQNGCAAWKFIDGLLTRCGCRAYRPITGEPALFDLPAPHPAVDCGRAAS
jgi:hypothetical protein